VANVALPATVARGAAPGLFTFVVRVPIGYAGQSLTLGATFDGAPIVAPATIPVALDSWNAGYPPYAEGGCNASSSRPSYATLWMLGLLLVFRNEGFLRLWRLRRAHRRVGLR
jgi:hypothetical protein